MITIVCPQCQKNYTFDEGKIPADLQLIECKICKTRFPLNPETDDPPVNEELPSDFAGEHITEESKVVSLSAFSARKFPSKSDQGDLRTDSIEKPLTDDRNSICLLSLSPDQSASELHEEDLYIGSTEADAIEGQSALAQLDFSADEFPIESIGAHFDLDVAPTEEKRIEATETDAQFTFSAERFRSLNAQRKNSERKFLFYCFLLMVCLILISYFIYAG
ncbi:MAG: zinc-ribbon domain-containing protein [Desulfoferrobacter sp.]